MTQHTQQVQETRPAVLAGMAAYNEAGHVAAVVEQARRYVDEVIVVDDGSSDNTAEVAESAGATVVRHAQNRGKGAAIKTILAEARKRRPRVLVLLDADGQHDPNEIPTLVKPISEGFDLVIGSRQAQDEKTPPYRRIGRTVLLHSTRLASRTHISDSESGYRALSPRAIEELHPAANGFAVESEMITLAADKKLKITEVPITNIYTTDGSTIHPVRQGVDVLGGLIRLIAQRRPLLVFGLLGGAMLAAGLIVAVSLLRAYLAGGVLPVGRTVLAVLFLVAAVLAFGSGIVLTILGRPK
jgi:hypothetical protein